MKSNKPILVVDDDQIDAMTVKRALKDNDILNDVIIAENGEKALEYLRNENMPRPCIILLDLNMPKMNGLECLKLIKTDEKIQSIPVIVLTTSRSEQDKMESFKLGIAGYMIKAVNYHEFVDIIRTIKDYWDVSELPD